MPAKILTLADLFSRVPANVIKGYFNDSGLNTISENDQIVQDVLMAAEGEMYSRLMRAYPSANGSQLDDGIKKLADTDQVVKMHLAWIACELACERRPEFTDAQGWGAYRAQYDRAISYFENLSKGLIRSRGEATAGAGANTGGASYPHPDTPEANFIFAPSRNAPTGRGGF